MCGCFFYLGSSLGGHFFLIFVEVFWMIVKNCKKKKKTEKLTDCRYVLCRLSLLNDFVIFVIFF